MLPVNYIKAYLFRSSCAAVTLVRSNPKHHQFAVSLIQNKLKKVTNLPEHYSVFKTQKYIQLASELDMIRNKWSSSQLTRVNGCRDYLKHDKALSGEMEYIPGSHEFCQISLLSGRSSGQQKKVSFAEHAQVMLADDEDKAIKNNIAAFISDERNIIFISGRIVDLCRQTEADDILQPDLLRRIVTALAFMSKTENSHLSTVANYFLHQNINGISFQQFGDIRKFSLLEQAQLKRTLLAVRLWAERIPTCLVPAIPSAPSLIAAL